MTTNNPSLETANELREELYAIENRVNALELLCNEHLDIEEGAIRGAVAQLISDIKRSASRAQDLEEQLFALPAEDEAADEVRQ